ncbi:hypothetical protein Moror_13324 [Moniliophthora roreri MCA 2997]|uniref:Uncharacterized protein n=1 Tax=Moniliophthora roreri (strain MCA 2997) TaxID=1381753 RepID=V2WST8_MONRO|nr:hypothetical protein Moror_13324 [Moniliophthora roreri MCA 2997]
MASPQPAPTQFELELDPGITPRRKPSSGWRFVSWIGVIICVLFISKFIFSVGRTAFDLTQFAHTSVYQNQTWEEVAASGSRDAVVRPLINDTQTFDVAITVWLRRTHEEVEERKIQKDKSPPTDENQYYLMAYEDDDIYEKAIFSDVVFRGLTLKDKDVGAKVPLQIPTQVLCVTFTVFLKPIRFILYLQPLPKIIPLRPPCIYCSYPKISFGFGFHLRLFHLVSLQSQMAPHEGLPVSLPSGAILSLLLTSVRRFPLNSSNPPDRGLRDRAIESFAISISLLSFHDTPSSCNEHAATEMSDDIFGSSERDESHGHPDYYGVTDSRWDRFADPSGKHPFVITR